MAPEVEGMTTPPREELVTVREYARLVDQDPQTIYRRIRKGTQPGVHWIDGRLNGAIRLEPPFVPRRPTTA